VSNKWQITQNIQWGKEGLSELMHCRQWEKILPFRTCEKTKQNKKTQNVVAAHLWWKSPFPPHPKGALLDWELVAVEAIWVQWTHCHVQETSLIWFELCDMARCSAGSSCQKMGTLWSQRDGHGQQQYSGRLWRLNDAQLVLRGPKCAKKILIQGRMDPCCHVVDTKFWPYHPNVTAEIETHQTRQCFSNLLLSLCEL